MREKESEIFNSTRYIFLEIRLKSGFAILHAPHQLSRDSITRQVADRGRIGSLSLSLHDPKIVSMRGREVGRFWRRPHIPSSREIPWISTVWLSLPILNTHYPNAYKYPGRDTHARTTVRRPIYRRYLPGNAWRDYNGSRTRVIHRARKTRVKKFVNLPPERRFFCSVVTRELPISPTRPVITHRNKIAIRLRERVEKYSTVKII